MLLLFSAEMLQTLCKCLSQISKNIIYLYLLLLLSLAFLWVCIHPCQLLEFVNCQNLVVSHVRLTNSPNKHLVFDGCNNLTVHGVTIMAPGDSPNTDGIVMQGCQQVQITRSKIGTGILGAFFFLVIFFFNKINVSVLDEIWWIQGMIALQFWQTALMSTSLESHVDQGMASGTT